MTKKKIEEENDELWFWTKRWQEGEKEVEEDKKTGRIYSFPDAKSAIASLHEYAMEVRKAKRRKIDSHR